MGEWVGFKIRRMLKPLEKYIFLYNLVQLLQTRWMCWHPVNCRLRPERKDGLWQVSVGKWGSLCHSIEDEMASRGLRGVPGIHGMLGGLVLRH